MKKFIALMVITGFLAGTAPRAFAENGGGVQAPWYNPAATQTVPEVPVVAAPSGGRGACHHHYCCCRGCWHEHRDDGRYRRGGGRRGRRGRFFKWRGWRGNDHQPSLIAGSIGPTGVTARPSYLKFCPIFSSNRTGVVKHTNAVFFHHAVNISRNRELSGT